MVVGDVSSHGMGPALLMSETRACLRTLALTTCDVGEILTRANCMLSADTHDFHFVTLVLARLDPARCEVVYGSAGQRSYLLHADGAATVLDSTSLPLGVDAETRVPAAPPFLLRPGDLMLLLTDGVVEAESADRPVLASAGPWKSSKPAAISQPSRLLPHYGADSMSSAPISRYKMT